jgi:CheY-like chemotaxis protein
MNNIWATLPIGSADQREQVLSRSRYQFSPIALAPNPCYPKCTRVVLDWGIPVKRVDLVKRRGDGKTVLVVDDNPGIRKAVCRAFLSDGFNVCGEAGNGQEAIRLCRQFKPDVILLDLSMPVTNGLQAAPELRKISPNMRIILFTMYGDELQQREVAAVGIDLVISKTEALSDVLNRVHVLLGD